MSETVACAVLKLSKLRIAVKSGKMGSLDESGSTDGKLFANVPVVMGKPAMGTSGSPAGLSIEGRPGSRSVSISIGRPSVPEHSVCVAHKLARRAKNLKKDMVTCRNGDFNWPI